MGKVGISKLCLLSGVCLSILTALCLTQLDQQHQKTPGWNAAWTLLTLMFMALAAVAFDMHRLDPAPSHSFTTLVGQYYELRYLYILGWASYLHFMWVSRDCRKLQDKLLLSIMKGNASCEYGQRLGFDRITSREEFVRKVPLTTYDDYRRDVVRIVERGEQNVTMSQDVTAIAVTTGTSGGAAKYIPLNDVYFKSVNWHLGTYHFSLRKQNSLKRSAFLLSGMLNEKSPQGLPMAALSSFHSKHRRHLAIPSVVYQIPLMTRSLYVQALFLLKERDVYTIHALMAPLCHAFFSILESQCDRLCRDLANGFLGEDVAVDEPTRAAIDQYLSADESRAAEVRREVSLGNVALARRLWPELRYIVVISTGAGFSHYRHLLETTYLNQTPHVSHMHVATEGLIGIFCERQGILKDIHFTMAVRMAFFEFIPESQVGEENPDTLFVDQLKRGDCYEVVLTTNWGLYRYRLGDLIKVTDYVNECPRYEFKCRIGMSLNVQGERTTEPVIVQAMLLVERKWENIHLVNFTTTESHVLQSETGATLHCGEDGIPGYVFFVEVEKKDTHGDIALSSEKTEKVDEILREISNTYNYGRRIKEVGRCQVVQVRRGTFEKLKHLIAKDTAQFKMPTVVRRQELLEFLLGSASPFEKYQ